MTAEIGAAARFVVAFLGFGLAPAGVPLGCQSTGPANGIEKVVLAGRS
jgi:hypothetical protein